MRFILINNFIQHINVSNLVIEFLAVCSLFIPVKRSLVVHCQSIYTNRHNIMDLSSNQVVYHCFDTQRKRFGFVYKNCNIKCSLCLFITSSTMVITFEHIVIVKYIQLCKLIRQIALLSKRHLHLHLSVLCHVSLSTEKCQILHYLW